MAKNRHIVTYGIILRTFPFREIDRNFTCISPDLGVIRVTAYGASKINSRFCGTVQPITLAKLFLYHNPQDDSYKLEDISDVETNDEIKQDIKKIFLLSFCIDVICESFLSSEEYKNYYYLLLYTIDLLKNTNYYTTAFLFFVSKYFFLSGYIPNTSSCSDCGKQTSNYYFDSHKGGVVCGDCCKFKKFPMDSKTLNIFEHFLQDKYATLRHHLVDQQTFGALYPICMEILDNLFEHKLRTSENLKTVFS